MILNYKGNIWQSLKRTMVDGSKIGEGDMGTKRSKGIAIFAYTQIFLGICLFLGSMFKDGDLIRYLISLSVSAILVLSGIYLLHLKRWARLVSMLVIPGIIGLYISAVFSILFYFYPQIIVWIKLPRVVNILISYVLYIIYFTRPKVKEQFK